MNTQGSSGPRGDSQSHESVGSEAVRPSRPSIPLSGRLRPDYRQSMVQTVTRQVPKFGNPGTLVSAPGWDRLTGGSLPLIAAVQKGCAPLPEAYETDLYSSIFASLISITGMSSRIGYTRRHCVHLSPWPFSVKLTGTLQRGQTRIFRSSGLTAIDAKKT